MATIKNLLQKAKDNAKKTLALGSFATAPINPVISAGLGIASLLSKNKQSNNQANYQQYTTPIGPSKPTTQVYKDSTTYQQPYQYTVGQQYTSPIGPVNVPSTNAVPQQNIWELADSAANNMAQREIDDYDAYYNTLSNYNKGINQYQTQNQIDQFNQYADNQAANFEIDRYNLDDRAAASGNLFGGARKVSRSKLQDQYNRDIEGRRTNLANALSQAQMQYEYEMGSDNTPSISLTSPTFNAMNALPDVQRQTQKVYSPKLNTIGRVAAEKDTAVRRLKARGVDYGRNGLTIGDYYQYN